MRFIAFLRAINVGGRNIKMDKLRGLFEALDLADVETFIASGNVIFQTDISQAGDAAAREVHTLERKIERHLHATLGYEVATFVRSAAQVNVIAGYEPFSRQELATEGNTLYVGFLPSPPAKDAQERLMALRNDVDDFHVHGSEAYWLRRRNVGESSFSAALLEETMETPATLRNANTVRRLAAKYPISDTDGRG